MGCGGTVLEVRVEDVEEMGNEVVNVEIRGCGDVGREIG